MSLVFSGVQYVLAVDWEVGGTVLGVEGPVNRAGSLRTKGEEQREGGRGGAGQGEGGVMEEESAPIV